MICAKCKTLIRPRPSVCEVCQPPVPAVEGEPDRAEVLEFFADSIEECAHTGGCLDFGGQSALDVPAWCTGIRRASIDDRGRIEVTVGRFVYYLKLDRVEKI